MKEGSAESRALPTLAERLREHSTYFATLAGEVEALPFTPAEDGAEEASSLLPPADLEDDSDPIPVPQRISSDLELALKLLEEDADAKRRVEETWSRLQDGTAKSARSVPAPRLSARNYPEYGDGRSQVDVRL